MNFWHWKKYGRGFEVLFGSNYVTKTNSIRQIRQIDRVDVTAEGSADDTWSPDTTDRPDGDTVTPEEEIEHGFEEDGCCGIDSTGKFHQIIGENINPIGIIAILNCLCAEFLLELEINLPESSVDGDIIGRFRKNDIFKMSFCSMAPSLWNQQVFRTSKGPALTVESLFDPSNGLHYFVINHYGVHHELYIATRPGWNNLKIEVSTQKIALYNNDTFQLDHEINTRSLNISYSRKYVYSTRPVLLNWFIQRKIRLFFHFEPTDH